CFFSFCLSFLIFLFLFSTNFYGQQFICFVLLFMFGRVSCIGQTPYSYLLFFLFVTTHYLLLHALFDMFYSHSLRQRAIVYFFIIRNCNSGFYCFFLYNILIKFVSTI